MPWGTVGEAPCKKSEGVFPQMNFVPWIVLGHNYMTPVLNIYIHCILTGYQFRAIEPNPMKGYSGCCPKCAQSGYDFLPCFHSFPGSLYSTCQAIVFMNWSILSKFWERAALSIFSMCLLAFIYTYAF